MIKQQVLQMWSCAWRFTLWQSDWAGDTHAFADATDISDFLIYLHLPMANAVLEICFKAFHNSSP
jgi:hypothetical protein